MSRTDRRYRLAFRASAAAALALLLVAEGAEARPKRPMQIPNGMVNGCANCHVSPAGGGPRNAFGQQVEGSFLTAAGSAGDVIWGPALAALDAEGDGATNGEELRDPKGTWRAGDPNPGEATAVTLPGNPGSFPPPATAVSASTWAQIKAAIQPRD